MAEISRALRKTKDVRLVSVSIDPTHDTPAVLAEYAARMNADPSRWIFLTGPENEITEFTQKGMLQVLAKDPKNIPTLFILLTKKDYFTIPFMSSNG
jgi:cytochrome oxidase Cu insertion factor (SCO1/SenC/PrrC family)